MDTKIERLLSELNHKVKSGFTSLCCKLDNSSSNSKSIFMACDPDDGSPVIVSYGYEGTDLVITYTNIDGSLYEGDPVVQCSSTDYEITNFQWFCVGGSTQVSRSDLYINGVFNSFIWQNLAGTVISPPATGTYTIGDCRGEYDFIPGCVKQLSIVDSTLHTGIGLPVGTLGFNIAIVEPDPSVDTISRVYVINADGSITYLNYTGVAISYEHHPSQADLIDGTYNYQLVIETTAGFKHTNIASFTIESSSYSCKFFKNSNSNYLSIDNAANSYYVDKGIAYAAYDKYGNFIKYTPTPDINNTLVLGTEIFDPNCQLEFNNKVPNIHAEYNVDFLKEYNIVNQYSVNNVDTVIPANTVHSIIYSATGNGTVTINGVSSPLVSGSNGKIEATGLIANAVTFKGSGGITPVITVITTGNV